MYLTDLHTHSILSPDGHAPLAEMAGAAVKAGLSALCVTDHCDLLTGDGKRALTYDWTPGLAQFSETAPQFADKLTLCLGLELGEAYVSPSHARAILTAARDKLDFVIGSIHNDREENGGGEYYYMKFSTPDLCYAALDGYFTSMEELAALPDCYDVLGHIIYPLRYMERDGQDISLARFRDRLAGILRTVIDSGKGIEVNTNRGKTIAPWREILTLYRDLGGEIVTVGTDAHVPEHAGLGVTEACSLLRTCGFDRIAVYNRRTPEFYLI